MTVKITRMIGGVETTIEADEPSEAVVTAILLRQQNRHKNVFSEFR